MSVYRRSRVWWCEFQVAGERVRRSTGVATDQPKREALKAERTIRTKLEADAKRRAERDYTLSEACAIWLRERGVHLAEETKEQEAALLRLCALFDDDPLLRDIDGAAVAKALGRRRAMTVGPKMKRAVSEARVIRDTRDNLRRVLNYMKAVHNAAIVDIAWKELTIGVASPSGGRELAEAEEPAFWTGVREDYRDLVEFLMLAMVRRNEGLLKWEQVPLGANAIRVRVQKRKPGSPVEHRTLALGGRAMALIEAQRGRHPEFVWTYEVQVWRADPVTGRKVPTPSGERRPITPAGLASLWKTKRVREGAANFRVHDLRHHGASALVRETGSLKLASDRLGHSSIAVTSKFYAHLLDEDAKHAADAVEKAVRARRTLPAETESPHKNPHTERKRKRGAA